MANGKTIFQRIAEREIPADIIFEDDLCFAIRDINPQAPVHVLVIPKRPLPGMSSVQAGDEPLLGRLMIVVARLAEQLGLSKGYRTVINSGPEAGQTVDHLHIHILAGRSMTWPPG